VLKDSDVNAWSFNKYIEVTVYSSNEELLGSCLNVGWAAIILVLLLGSKELHFCSPAHSPCVSPDPLQCISDENIQATKSQGSSTPSSSMTTFSRRWHGNRTSFSHSSDLRGPYLADLCTSVAQPISSNNDVLFLMTLWATTVTWHWLGS
jgi:hypothetical protein